MRFNNDFGDRYGVCSGKGYDVHVEKSFYPIGEDKPNVVWLKDKLNRTAVISEFADEPMIRLFNTNITLEQAETLIKELQDGIEFGNYLRENL